MQAKSPDWYKYEWSLAIKDESWVEDTENQVDFIIKTLGLSGGERILDLACGFGRHALALAQRGFTVVGVDLTQAFIDDAAQRAKALSLPATFIQADIRTVSFESAFDVVLNLADGAIGYLETDEENLKIFDVIARALKPGGKHFMDVCNAEHAERYFPKTDWDAGEKALALAQFDWDGAARRMVYGSCDIPYGVPAQKPHIPAGDPIRLYSSEELCAILSQRGMKVLQTFSDYHGSPAAYKNLQLMVHSVKLG